MTNPLYAEVGRSYRNRRGELVNIVGLTTHPTRPLVGIRHRDRESDVQTYGRRGNFCCTESADDLVRAVKDAEPTPAPLRIVAGRSYCTRAGLRADIAWVAREGFFPVFGVVRVGGAMISAETWSDTGKWDHSTVGHHFDLIGGWHE